VKKSTLILAVGLTILVLATGCEITGATIKALVMGAIGVGIVIIGIHHNFVGE
jgi:hypothetical protein